MKLGKLFFLILCVSCHPSKNSTNKSAKAVDSSDTRKTENQTLKAIDFSVNPSVIIYKTKGDYFNLVPVTMNDEKTKIVSYPGPKDIYLNGTLALPGKLHGEYLLDNRGIGKNVVFLKITYAEYQKLDDAPPLSEMMKMIIDKSSLTEMYNCGSRYQYKDIVSELNQYIDAKQLSKFHRVL